MRRILLKFKFYNLILSLLCLVSLQSFPQAISFKHLSINQGLSQNAVYAIMQDSKGFMWFGTKDGLNKYDGYSFTIFNHDPFDKNTISENYVTSLSEDSRHLIWVGTFNGEINIYNYNSGIFTNVNLRLNPSLKINSTIVSIVEDADSNIWIGTQGNGLIKLTMKDGESFPINYKVYLESLTSNLNLSNNNVNSLFVDSDGILWVGSDKSLNRFNPNEDNFTQFSIIPRQTKSQFGINGISINSICEDKNGKLWLGTVSGIASFNKNSGEYKFYPHHYEVYRFGWGIVNGILQDSEGMLWLATPGELMKFDPIREIYSYYRNDPFNSQSLSYNIISSLFKDRTGILWFGTSGGGINIYDPKSLRFSTLKREKDSLSRITGFSIRSIIEDHAGTVWIGSDVLYEWNRKTEKLFSYETSSNRPNDFGNTGIWTLVNSSDGKIWAASTEGLFSHDPSTKKTRHYEFKPKNPKGLTQRNVNAVCEDRKGNIWIVTENYLSRLINIEKGEFEHYKYQSSSKQNNQSRIAIFQDSTNIFWLGTQDGLIRFDPKIKSSISFRNNPEDTTTINNNHIKSICPDPFEPSKYLWIGTSGGGLNKLNIEAKTFIHFTEKDGLSNNVVYGILPDEDENLWMSTNNGLSKFNLKKQTFRNFNISDGLQSNEFNTGAFYKSKSGEMFFGGINGLNYFYPKNILNNPFVPNVVITDFKLLNQTTSSKKIESEIRKTLNNKEHIILSHENNLIQFEFAALDYSAPEKNQYAYKLENYNEDWIYSGTVRTATYTKLPPGEYIFKIKASNNDNIWNEIGTSIKLTITPPWWNTWWSYFLYGMLILTGLYLIRRYELNRLNLKTQLKLEKVATDSLRNLDNLKSRFFANISHEFRTPLSLILGQIDSVMSSNVDAREKSKLQVANRNAKRLLTLINQLLDLSKIESGRMELNSEQHNIVSFLKSLFYSFESLASTQKLTLKFESQFENIPVAFDQDKMEKVFYNLLSNSFKFTPPEGMIKVSLNTIENNFVEIKIIDTGIGIPEDQVQNIFNRFYQVDNSSTREHGGTGIGLALTKELVELHKGKISVKSEVGIGTEFIINLPLGSSYSKQYKTNNFKQNEVLNLNKYNLELNPEIKLQELNNNDQNSNNKLSVKLNKEIILIVEDNNDVSEYIKEQLENEYNIIQAFDGMEGFNFSQKEIPDLIISDVMMPKMDGYQFCKKIRNEQNTSHIPIIMLTAKAGIDNKIEGLKTGVDAYLTKPFSAKELNVRVKNLIYLRKQLRQKFSNATIIKPSEVSVISIDQEFLEKTTKLIEEHFEDENFTVEILADKLNMSISQLNRKLNALINQPGGQLIRSLKLQRAADLLKQNAGTIAEICYKLGFTDQAYFSRVFKKQFGLSPSEYKKN